MITLSEIRELEKEDKLGFVNVAMRERIEKEHYKIEHIDWYQYRYEYVDKTGENRIGYNADYDFSVKCDCCGKQITKQFNIVNFAGEKNIIGKECAHYFFGHQRILIAERKKMNRHIK